MSARVEQFLRPAGHEASSSWEATALLGATAITLAMAVAVAITLPMVMVPPAVSLALFVGSVLPVLATSRTSPRARERARLFSGMLFAIGVAASVLSDLDALVTFLG